MCDFVRRRLTIHIALRVFSPYMRVIKPYALYLQHSASNTSCQRFTIISTFSFTERSNFRKSETLIFSEYNKKNFSPLSSNLATPSLPCTLPQANLLLRHRWAYPEWGTRDNPWHQTVRATIVSSNGSHSYEKQLSKSNTGHCRRINACPSTPNMSSFQSVGSATHRLTITKYSTIWVLMSFGVFNNACH